MGKIWIKRVVAEMGGKDAIIVADDANLDDAATGVVQSAFGFQGQKCSACSRAIIDARVYDQMLEKIAERTEKIKMGDPNDAATNMSAVINEKAFKTINEYIEKGKSEGGRVVSGGGSDGEQGFFIEPTVIADVKPGATIEQEEIFGPVLAVIKAQDYDDALKIANDTQYGLTGAVYSADEEKLERARREFHVGQPLSQPQVHRSAGGRSSVWRLQYVGHRFEGGRPRLSFAVHAGEGFSGEGRGYYQRALRSGRQFKF